MSFLFGPLLVMAVLGGISLAMRAVRIPFSILGALAAVLRRTESPRLQRRQALVLLLFVAGLIALLIGSVQVSAGTFTTAVLTTVIGGVLLVTISGHLGSRTLRAIGREPQQP